MCCYNGSVRLFMLDCFVDSSDCELVCVINWKASYNGRGFNLKVHICKNRLWVLDTETVLLMYWFIFGLLGYRVLQC